ncbi:MAG: dTMP kinase [Candidatus Omnitrophica bacterium]|nr:dTMP kinase [Candidatus Omnitrophota bacterium]
MENLMVVFEGIDGAGKGTQIENLKKALKKMKKKFFVFKYPSEKSKKIRKYLQQKIDMNEDEAFFEYINDIAAQQNEIREKLQKGWIICDRYFFSTLAYQSLEKDLSERIEAIKNFRLIEPDVVVWLYINPQDAIKRKLKNRLADRFEKDLEKLKKIEQNYQKLYSLKFMAKKWIKVESFKDKKEVFEDIAKEIFKGF